MGARVIARGHDWVILTSDEGRTAMPYKAEAWGNGNVNHPYVNLIEHLDKVDEIPEVRSFPSLGSVLRAINAEGGAFQSTACDPGILPTTEGGLRFSAGATVHVAFRDDDANLNPFALVALAHALQDHLIRPTTAFRLRLMVEPYKNWKGRSGYFGLAMEFCGLGNTESEAWIAAEAASLAVASAIRAIDGSVGTVTAD